MEWKCVQSILVCMLLALPASAALPTFTSTVELRTPAGTPAGESDVEFAYVGNMSSGYGAAGTSDGGLVRWAADGSATLLPIPPGYTGGALYAFGINNAGRVVGTAWDVGAVSWEPDGSPTILDGTATAGAYSINNIGQAVGESLLPSEKLSAVRWSADGSMTILGDVPGRSTFSSVAYRISDTGFVSGYAELATPDEGGGQLGVPHAVRWSNDGSATLLGKAPGQRGPSYAPGVNNAGEAAGYAYFPGVSNFLAVRWAADGSATRLGDLPGDATALSQAWGITDKGLIAGYQFLPDIGNIGVIWDADGTPWMLQDLMADGNSWEFYNTIGIDADATTLRVLALGSKNGGPPSYYFANASIPEPATVALLALGLPLLVCRKSLNKTKKVVRAASRAAASAAPHAVRQTMSLVLALLVLSEHELPPPIVSAATLGEELFRLISSHATTGEQFRYSQGSGAKLVIVGSPYSSSGAINSAGSAYLFDVASGEQLIELRASDADADEWFGFDPDIRGCRAIVGAPSDGSTSPLHDAPGAAYLFDTVTGSRLFKLTIASSTAGDRFDRAVAIDGGLAIVCAQPNSVLGAKPGSAYLCTVATGEQLLKMTASDAAAGDQFGASVAVSVATATQDGHTSCRRFSSLQPLLCRRLPFSYSSVATHSAEPKVESHDQTRSS